MPALDPIQYDPTRDGPTNLQRNMRAIGRREPFQIQAAGPVPIQMSAKPRPMTHRVTHQMSAGRTPVLHRASNANPDNAGQGPVTSSWGLSGPDADGQDRTMIDDAREGIGIGMTALIGVGLGGLIYALSRR